MDRLRPDHAAPAPLPVPSRPAALSRIRWRRVVDLVRLAVLTRRATLDALCVVVRPLLAGRRPIPLPLSFGDLGGGDDDWEQDILDDDGPPPGRPRPASPLSDHLAVICVGTGCTGVLAIIVIEFMHPTAIGLTAIGAIAAAAFRAGSVHGLRRGGDRR